MLGHSNCLLFGLVLVFGLCVAEMASIKPIKVGGTGAVKDASGVKEVFELVQLMRPNYENQMKLAANAHAEFTPVKYRTQLVSGMNYFVKVRIAPNEYVHLRIYRPLQGPTVLHGIQTSKTEADPLEYFDQNQNLQN